QALDFGLIEHVSAPEQLLTDSMTMAREIAGNSPIAVRHIKHCVDEGLDLPLERALALERDYWAGLTRTGTTRKVCRPGWKSAGRPIRDIPAPATTAR
ncbi:MAG: hypothetical protein IPJ97_11620, partial [Proteobacteria bacterium]|nr:hypothetical protein [Pseudomonadota bacterium]